MAAADGGGSTSCRLGTPNDDPREAATAMGPASRDGDALGRRRDRPEPPCAAVVVMPGVGSSTAEFDSFWKTAFAGGHAAATSTGPPPPRGAAAAAHDASLSDRAAIAAARNEKAIAEEAEMDERCAADERRNLIGRDALLRTDARIIGNSARVIRRGFRDDVRERRVMSHGTRYAAVRGSVNDDLLHGRGGNGGDGDEEEQGRTPPPQGRDGSTTNTRGRWGRGRAPPLYDRLIPDAPAPPPTTRKDNADGGRGDRGGRRFDGDVVGDHRRTPRPISPPPPHLVKCRDEMRRNVAERGGDDRHYHDHRAPHRHQERQEGNEDAAGDVSRPRAVDSSAGTRDQFSSLRYPEVRALPRNSRRESQTKQRTPPPLVTQHGGAVTAKTSPRAQPANSSAARRRSPASHHDDDDDDDDSWQPRRSVTGRRRTNKFEALLRADAAGDDGGAFQLPPS